eukprot:GHVO01037235.1.p1 GENE.GHVO01037235.1~~GHVO01037235.1.p1  ORF type:complete len:184 (+),score=21.70 GHVO01037235.1:181-732(+)
MIEDFTSTSCLTIFGMIYHSLYRSRISAVRACGGMMQRVLETHEDAAPTDDSVHLKLLLRRSVLTDKRYMVHRSTLDCNCDEGEESSSQEVVETILGTAASAIDGLRCIYSDTSDIVQEKGPKFMVPFLKYLNMNQKEIDPDAEKVAQCIRLVRFAKKVFPNRTALEAKVDRVWPTKRMDDDW